MKILERVRKTELTYIEWAIKLFIVFIVAVPVPIIGGALLGLIADRASSCSPLFLVIGIIAGSVLSFFAVLYVIVFRHKV